MVDLEFLRNKIAETLNLKNVITGYGAVTDLISIQFTEKRRELKFDGRSDKELAESYAFLMVDRCQVSEPIL